MVLAAPVPSKVRLTARFTPSQAAVATPLAFTAVPPTRTARVPVTGSLYWQLNSTLRVALAKAGAQARLLSAFFTAETVMVCCTSATWLATLKSRPLSANDTAQLAALVAVFRQVVAPVVGATPEVPRLTAPTALTGRLAVVLEAPALMVKALVPLATPLQLRLPVTAPLVYRLEQPALAQALMVTVSGVQVRPLPSCSSCRWSGPGGRQVRRSWCTAASSVGSSAFW